VFKYITVITFKSCCC